ncbi:right-handed parallel beta-helix repeat-containing protein [candidate division WOR-3 bacterium]|nr:right-handed parallel beta-helix repeat-containing protein [candidate division WOR-3 bacterium]
MKRSMTLAALAATLLLTGCPVTDTTNPVVTIVIPTNGAVLAPGTVTIKAVATDNKSVVKVEFYAGATKIGEDATGTADTFDVSWTAALGAYTLKAVASDAADNTGEHTIAVTIQTGGGGTGPQEHDNDIVGGDSIWYPSGNPHVVKRRLAIADNGKLTIMPGCIVRFRTGAGFTVGDNSPGQLLAVGKPGADSMIYFTSDAASPVPGDWEGFDFYEATRTGTRFSYCEINYGGYGNYGAVNLDWGGTIKMDHTTIKNAPKYGIWAGDFTGYIEDFNGNTITACGSYPIYMGAAEMSKMSAGNTLTGNAIDAIYVSGGGVTETGTWRNQGVPYVLGASLDIGADNGPVLTIETGSTLKFTSGHHLALGYTVPAGLIADSVTFTSAASNPQQGDWNGIWFYGASTDAQCRLTRCVVAYGGGDDYGNVWAEDAKPTITGCNIRDSKGWGIYLTGAEYPDPDTLEANNTFSNNLLGNVRRP